MKCTTLFFQAVCLCFLCIVFALFFCRLKSASMDGSRKADNGTVQIVIEEGSGFSVDRNTMHIRQGEDLSFRIYPEEDFEVMGTDYRNYVLSQMSDGTVTCILRDVRYPVIVSILTEKHPYHIIYHANGGELSNAADTASFSVRSPKNASVERAYSSKHLRVNTEQGTSFFSNNGYTLASWNTKADGSGEDVPLGSRITMPEDGTAHLYAVWKKWNNSSDFIYEENASSITITGYQGFGKEIVIPAKMMGKEVTVISSYAFSDAACDAVYLPYTVKTVLPHAFENCSLQLLVFFDTLTDITDYAVDGCNNLRTIRINAALPPVYSGSYFSTFPDKYDRLYALRNEKKLVLFSGSSTRFGYDSAYLEEELSEYAVVNMGVFAYSNALPQFYLMLPLMKKGDLLLHSPEFDAAKRQFCTTNAIDDKFFCMIEGNYALLELLDYRQFDSILSAFKTYQSVRNGMEEKPYALSASDFDEDGIPVGTPSYNLYGDYILLRPNAKTDAPIYGLPVDYTVSAFPKSLYIDTINRVYRQFTDRGIRLMFTYAPRNCEALSEKSTVAERAALHDYLKDVLEVPVISSLEESLYPGRYFYGTDNHLSTEGVRIRTERIIRDIRNYMDGKGLL